MVCSQLQGGCMLKGEHIPPSPHPLIAHPAYHWNQFPEEYVQE